MIKQRSGAIVCTASVAGLKSGASGHPYAASKAGVISLVQTTAYSLSGTGVRINAVCPGLIETGMTKPIFDRAKERGTARTRSASSIRLKRAGQPHELAAMGLFLRQRRGVLRQRPGDPGRWRPHRLDAVCGQADLSLMGALAGRPRHCERSEAIHVAAKERLDCFVANAPRNDVAPTSNTPPRSHGAIRPSYAKSFALKSEGAGKAGCRLHPQPRARSVVSTRVSHHRFTGTPAFPAQWFYGLFRALPGDRAFLPPSSV